MQFILYLLVTGHLKYYSDHTTALKQLLFREVAVGFRQHELS